MKMLVTGAAGFIGSHLVDALLAREIAVVATDNLSRGRGNNLANANNDPGFLFVPADLGDPEALPEAVGAAGPYDIVWHMAANSDISAGILDETIDFRDTFQSTRSALAICRGAGVPGFVFASSSAVYGEHPNPLTESTGPLLPISNYGAMKLAAEAAVSAATESFLKSAWIMRFPNIVGGRSTHGVIHDFCQKLDADPESLDVLGNGSQQKPYLHVSELIEAMLFIVDQTKDLASRNLYNIGPEDEGVAVSDIARAVVDRAGGRAAITYQGGDRGWVGDVPRFSYSTEKLRKLGWRPQLSSREAMLRAVDECCAEWGLG